MNISSNIRRCLMGLACLAAAGTSAQALTINTSADAHNYVANTGLTFDSTSAARGFISSSSPSDFLTIDPVSGLLGNFVWVKPRRGSGSGFGVNRLVTGSREAPVVSRNDARVQAASDSLITLKIWDSGIAGDDYDVFLDGVLLAPTGRGSDAGGFKNVSYLDVLLSTGQHDFSIFLAATCCRYGSRNVFEFSGLTTVPAPVPLPAGLPLLGTALGAIGVLRYRRRRKETAGRS